jgi:2-polyprenyl-3-methyl-5-hydroxy-6-metoxy-1,4-benzoquinol methylase
LNATQNLSTPGAEVTAGHYAQKQLLSRSALVRWSHGSRFRLARELVTPHAGKRLLDYGCGDGTFLALVHDLFPYALGVDVASDQLDDCSQRFATVPGISFLSTDRLIGLPYVNQYEIVVCMEVLEHCPDDIQVSVLDQIQRVTAVGGTVIFSVPIEIGPPLVAKQCARALVALGGLSEYATRERYQTGELMRMVFANADTEIPREEFITHIDVEGEAPRTSRFTGHKGFNWRRLQRLVEARFTVERRLFSPLPLLGAWLNSQVWLICKNGT